MESRRKDAMDLQARRREMDAREMENLRMVHEDGLSESLRRALGLSRGQLKAFPRKPRSGFNLSFIVYQIYICCFYVCVAFVCVGWVSLC